MDPIEWQHKFWYTNNGPYVIQVNMHLMTYINNLDNEQVFNITDPDSLDWSKPSKGLKS